MMRDCQCVFPKESEQELVTIPGAEAGTALRIYLQSGPGGYLRLQDLAHSPGMGWYVQKSMVVEREVLEALIPQLRKALCLIPKGKTDFSGVIKFPRLAQPDEGDEELTRAG